MLSPVAIFFIAIPVYYVLVAGYGLWKNVRAARKSGLPYVVLPIYAYNPLWLLFGRRSIRWFVNRFPNLAISKSYLIFLIPEWSWREGFEPYRQLGDVFMTVTPSNCTIFVANREAITQIVTRRDDFPKPLWMYKSVEVFGKNVVTTDGQEWKFHRKVTSPSFGEKNNALVFLESIRQTNQMLRKWVGVDDNGKKTVHEPLEDTHRLSLHVISAAGFGATLDWPGETKDADVIRPMSSESTYQHKMQFKDALSDLLHYLLVVLIMPKWLMKSLPFNWAKKAAAASEEYAVYMDELFSEKKKEAVAGERGDGMDIMGALVKNSYGPENRFDNKKAPYGDLERQKLSDSEILGNAFVLLLAGHETSAGSLHYTLILLALQPDVQRDLQADIDRIFGDRPIDEWDYSRDIVAMQNSMIAAVMNEQLRIIPPVISIPKMVRADQDQIVNIDGKQTVWPKGAVIGLAGLALHRNPRYWPTLGASRITDRDNDLDDFVPRRWLLGNSADGPRSNAAEKDASSVDSTQSPIYQPLKGSYIPFSDGARSCLGKRFAQVEIMAVLAVIFKQYSVELAVDDTADEAVERMSAGERISLYNKQRKVARHVIRYASEVRITVQIRGKDVPIRLVPRGRERFIHLLDS